MKRIKRFTAILLSAIMLLSVIPCSVFAEDIPDKLTCYFGDDNSIVFNYGFELKLGKNDLGPDEDDAIFYSFVPRETGVYSFSGCFDGITADTNDNVCYSEDWEDTLCLWTYGSDEYGDWSRGGSYCVLTAGKMYYVLSYYWDMFSNISVEYLGNVTDVNPVNPLTDLMEGYDLIEYDWEEYGRHLYVRETFEVTFSNSDTTAYLEPDIYFDQGFYTDSTVTWSYLNFEKVLPYRTISVYDMIDSVEPQGNVNLIRYFDYCYELKDPVDIKINFKDGTSTTVTVEDFDQDVDYLGSNGRTYSIGFSDYNVGSCALYSLGVALKHYDAKSAGLFKNLSRYITRRAEIRALYKEMLNDNDFTAAERRELLKERNEDLAFLTTEFFKAIFLFR
ncbi:MAG: hypothetical protein K5756_09920 [Clostridiales bacterium]|nr:hypothetical protein [Clostridiales bacterium]